MTEATVVEAARSGGLIAERRRVARQRRHRWQLVRRVALGAGLVLPWTWFLFRRLGGLVDLLAIALPPLALATTAVLLLFALAIRRWGAFAVAASAALAGLAATFGPWIPQGSRTDPIAKGAEVRMVSLNAAAHSDPYLLAAIQGQTPDVMVVAELQRDLDADLEPLYPFHAETAAVYHEGTPPPRAGLENLAGVGVFSRYPFEVLPDATDLPEGMPGLRVRVQLPAGPVVLYALHLPKPAPRLDGVSVTFAQQEQLYRSVRRAMLAETEPVLVAGDFNMSDRTQAWRSFSAGFGDAMRAGEWAGPTSFKASRVWRALLLRIDHILLPPGYCAASPHRFSVPSSDHHGIAATIGPCA